VTRLAGGHSGMYGIADSKVYAVYAMTRWDTEVLLAPRRPQSTSMAWRDGWLSLALWPFGLGRELTRICRTSL
jgi:hypothetical protein